MVSGLNLGTNKEFFGCEIFAQNIRFGALLLVICRPFNLKCNV